MNTLDVIDQNGYLLKMEGISKAFPGVVALKDVHMEVGYGKAHALMGENGAGKSTLMKILTGIIQPDNGKITFQGKEIYFNNPSAALSAGIVMIHQELSPIPEMTIAENILIGREPVYKILGIVNRKKLRQTATELLKLMDLSINPDTKMKELSISEMQMVEIVKALSYKARLIIMDEPTSASNYEWFIEMFLAEEKQKAKELGMNVFEYCNELAEKVTADDQNIIFLPYIFGSNYNPQAKASFIGLDSHHTRPQIIRAVLEGIVFCHMVHLEKLLANRTITQAVRLAGGAANSLLWAQIFADGFKLPVEIVDTKELGTLGCAMAATVAAGVYTDLKEAAQNMVKMKCRIEPIPANFSIYEKKFALYKKISGVLDGLWKDFN